MAAVIVIAIGLTAISSHAADATFAGKYSDGNLTIDLAPSADGYAGTITLHSQQFPATAHAGGSGLTGTFTSGANSFPFTATLDADTLTLSTGSKTYQLKSLSPPANPLAAPAAPANPLATGSAPGDAPAGYTVITSTASGKSIATQKPNVTRLNDAFIATFSDLATYFGTRPTLDSAVQNAKDPTVGNATFSVTLNGQNNRGIVSCKLHDGSASISIVYGQADAPKSDWDKLMAPPAPTAAPAPQQAAAPAQPGEVAAANIPLTEYDYPDGTGSIGLATGWTTQSQSADDPTAVVGPADQTVMLHSSVMVMTPDSPVVAQRQRLQSQTQQMEQNMPQYHPKPLPPLLVAPLTDPATAVQNMIPQFSKRSEFNNGPSFTLDKIISSQDAPCKLPGGKRAVIDYLLTKTSNGQSTTYHVKANLITAPIQGNGAWMWFVAGSATAPQATFDQDLPIMLAIAKSEKVNQDKASQIAAQRNQQNIQTGQAMIAAQQKQFDANYAMNEQNFQTRQDIYKQQQAQTEAGYAAHNQQFNDYELQRSRNAADFNESIIGTRTIYNTVTGESGYANLTNVNAVVNGLNQAALDPTQWIQIPLRDQLYPLPPGR
jgi:hypothetical protein